MAPTATAAAFLATPASSTPTGSLETSHTTPARWNTSATRCASGPECEAHTSPAPVSSTISRACAGPPTQAVRSAPNARSSATVGRRAVGGHQPLGQRHHAGRRRHAQPLDLRQRLPHALRRHREEDQVGARELLVDGSEGAHLEVLREPDPLEVLPVLPRPLERRHLLGGAAQERGPDAGAVEQDRDRGAERAGAHHGGSVGVLAGIAERAERCGGSYRTGEPLLLLGIAFGVPARTRRGPDLWHKSPS